MAVTEPELAGACQAASGQLSPHHDTAKPAEPASLSLHALTAAALALPGLMLTPAYAVEVEETSFQYGHYEESKRQTYGIQSNLKPIQVDSLQGSGQVRLSDRVKFAFNYTQDTWGGATPVATAPLAFGGNHPNTQSGASPYLSIGTVYLDSKLNPLKLDSATGKFYKSPQLVHTLAMASPETRKQGDFKLGYEWDEAALDIGGGISVENDYESRFGNLLGRMDFNQKLTSVSLGLSYTNSDINATLDHDATPYIYDTSGGLKTYDATHSGSQIDIVGGPLVNNKILRGNRQDWATNLSLTQILNKNALIVGSFGFTRNTGYLANPYKAVTTVFVDPKQTPDPSGVLTGTSLSLLEKRPQERDQWIGNLGYVQHIDALDAALHFDYRLYHDDWGITSHTFGIDWAQPLFDGWTITPRIRYYSQDAADFYQPYLVSNQVYPGKASFDRATRKVTLSQLDPSKLPANYSSDQRLSAYGALSGGVTLGKKFAKGISLEIGAEYYTHAGSLKLGGGGEDSYADFDYYMFNAAVKLDLSALAVPGGMRGKPDEHGDHEGHGGHDSHAGHSHHNSHAPAGVMFDHMLGKAGDFMVGYRYMWSSQGGDMLHGLDTANDRAIVNNGCNGKPCYVTPVNMHMHMHMLDLMYAPTDWLTLMLMPQYMDMDMDMRPLDGAPPSSNADPVTAAAVQHAYHTHQTGGIGDTGMYGLFKLFEAPGHHLHATLGLSAPSGDVGIQLRNTHGVSIGFIHYGMQLGSGTWDFKPSLTYTGQSGPWSWGAQLSGTVRLKNQNASGFAFGDIFQTTAWGSYNLLDWLSASVRGVYTTQGALRGAYNATYTPVGPMDYGNSYGGRYWDVGFGLSAVVPTGNLQGNRFGVEWLQPVHDDANGYQLPREGSLSATWSYAF